MGFDPTASLYFHVIEYIEEEQDDECKGVNIYSSKTAAWIYKESKWGPNTCVTIERSEEMRSSETVYLNGCLHIMVYSGFYPQILAVDMEGETCGKFLARVVLHPPSIKLRVTCVYVLFMVAICPNF